MSIKLWALPLCICTMATSAFAQQSDYANLEGDEYDYQPTPVANQIADLQDDDNDGVINARDLCPDTPRGSEIDNDGCGTFVNSSQTQQLHILFANDSSAIDPAFLTQIRQMAEFLETYPSTSIELQGYASNVGRTEYNLALSKERSEAVRNQLYQYGVAPNRVNIVGYGDTVLEADGADDVSHARNRRVTATVVGYKGEVVKEWTIFTTLPM
ncbi:MAG: OmpA family protein [Vibrio sp.]